MKKTLVIGASTNPERYSYKAIVSLREHGFTVAAVGLKEGIVKDVSIMKKAEPLSDIDTVTLYINPALQAEYEDYIIATKPRRVIFNPGTENVHFEEKLKQNGINTEEACTLVLLSLNQY